MISSPSTPRAPDLTVSTVSQSNLSTSTKTVVDLDEADTNPGDTLQYTISITESGGVAATGVSVTDDFPDFVNNFTVVSVPSGATDNSTGAATGANGNGFLDVSDIAVTSSGPATIVFNVTVAGVDGEVISNTANIANPNGSGASPSAIDITISDPSAGGIKQLYLLHLSTTDPNGLNTGPRPYLSRTPATPPQADVRVDKNRPPVTWTLTPATQASLVFGNGPTIPVTLWVSKGGNGGGLVTRRLTLTLDSIGTTSVTIGTLVNQSFSAPRRSTPADVTFDIPVTSPPVTLSPGSQIRLTLQNTTSGGGNRRIRLFPIGTISNSRVELDSNTIINVDTVEFFDAAYPGGTAQTNVGPGTALFVRTVVSHPFCSFDSTGAIIDIIDPNSVSQVSGSSMTEIAVSLVATKTYEFPYIIPPAGPGGFSTARVTADEGMEGTVDDTGTGVVEMVTAMPDLVLMKTSQVNSDPFNLTNNPKRIPGAYVHYTIRLTNAGSGTVDNNTVVITDQIPIDTELYVGDLGGTPANSPVLFLDGPGAQTSGLTLVFSGLSLIRDGIDFSNNPGPSFNYYYDPTPYMDADGFDSNVTSIRINPSGVLKKILDL